MRLDFIQIDGRLAILDRKPAISPETRFAVQVVTKRKDKIERVV
jgi:hypothetical protein